MFQNYFNKNISDNKAMYNQNIENIKRQIFIKNNGSNPYFATTLNNKNVITEYDHFPFTRYWKGKPLADNVYVDGREAGFRIRDDKCYKGCNVSEVVKPNVCFQFSYNKPPCDPEIQNNLASNCIISYR